ncbi:MAG: hypothetical protein K5776_09725 [Lachnospiraceae bacterium]|nr:hypothetical protein [Lachnospiraceae bacterium]
MDTIILISFIAAAVIAAVIINIISNQNKIKRFAARLRKNFGTFERKEPDLEKKSSYRGYFRKHSEDEGFFIDDITWNDAEGETLYNSMNKCYSSCGEEYLYFRLRHPDLKTSKEEIEKYVSQTDELINDENLRVELQLKFATLGKTGKHSVYDYISLLSNVKRLPLVLFYAVWAVYFLVIASYFINVTLGVCVTIAWLIICIIFYLYNKRNIENYLTSFEYIVRTLITSEKIADMKVPFYEEESKRLRELRKEIKGIKTAYLSFIKQSNRSGMADMMSGMASVMNSFFLIDLFFFHKMLKYIIDKEDAYDEIFAILGNMESQICVANMKKAFDSVCVPEFVEENMISGKDMFHPLVKDCVENSFEAKRGMLITGSNASGKSTFLRSVLVNAILSQTVYVAFAKEFKLKHFELFSSMSLKDSLGAGESYYMAEINSIKRILNAKESGEEILCFLDEVLRGTNTVERVAAASEILKYLSSENVIPFAATHDIELTYLLENDYDNYFFREEILKEDDKEDIYFSYKINKGRSDTRNALLLLKIMGYPKEIFENAEALSKNFLNTGKWKYDEG